MKNSEFGSETSRTCSSSRKVSHPAHKNGLLPFEDTIEQTTETMPLVLTHFWGVRTRTKAIALSCLLISFCTQKVIQHAYELYTLEWCHVSNATCLKKVYEPNNAKSQNVRLPNFAAGRLKCTICCCSLLFRGSFNHSRQNKGSISKGFFGTKTLPRHLGAHSILIHDTLGSQNVTRCHETCIDIRDSRLRLEWIGGNRNHPACALKLSFNANFLACVAF